MKTRIASGMLLGALVVAVSPLVMTGCGSYTFDVVAFRRTSVRSSEDTTVQPSLWIDTHAKHYGSILVGGGARSSAPYDIVLNYTDESLAFSEMVLDSLAVTYADGTEEPAAAELPLPRTYEFRDHTARNSNGTEIVTTQVRLLEHPIPGVITKEQGFEVRIEGHFVTKTGAPVRFRFEESYERRHREERVPLYQVWKDV
jgi:hypothetical protein